MQLISLLLEKETISLMEMQHFEKSVTLLGTETGSCYLAWLVQYQPPNQQSPFWITLSPERSGKCHPESTSGEVTQDLPFWKAAPQLSAFFFLPPRFFFFLLILIIRNRAASTCLVFPRGQVSQLSSLLTDRQALQRCALTGEVASSQGKAQSDQSRFNVKIKDTKWGTINLLRVVENTYYSQCGYMLGMGTSSSDFQWTAVFYHSSFYTQQNLGPMLGCTEPILSKKVLRCKTSQKDCGI